MPNVLVRDVETTILEKIKERAAQNGRSLQTEVQAILRRYSETAEPLSDSETAAKIKISLQGRNHSDSAELLCEDRNR